jgi:hypothetical protein
MPLQAFQSRSGEWTPDALERYREPELSRLRARAAAAYVTAGVLLALARFPYLASPNYILDGDEAILGLMARHLTQGRELPVFFYGQNYGFSLLEVVPAAAAFALFGSGPLVLALAMLGLFLVGLLFWERALAHLAGSRAWGRTLALTLGLLPVWIVWSTKARGGYLSAFALVGVAAWLLSRDRFSRGDAVLTGLVVGAAFQAQPLWVPGLLPMLVLPVLTERARPARIGLALAATGAMIFALGALSGQFDGAWGPAVLLGFSTEGVLVLPTKLFQMFGGFFYLGDVFAPPLLVGAVAALCTLAYFGVMVLLGAHAVRHRCGTSALLGFCLLLGVAPLIFLTRVPPRYLIAASVYLAVGMAAWIGLQARPFGGPGRTVAVSWIVLLVASSLQMGALRTHAAATGSDAELELERLVETLEANDVQAVYSLHGLLQWQITFYSGESIPARYRYAVDRYPPLIARVDSIRAAGGRTALVGPARMLPAGLEEAVYPVGSDYFALPDPPDRMLRLFGFELPEG